MRTAMIRQHPFWVLLGHSNFEIPIERIKGPLVGPSPIPGGTGSEFVTTEPIDVTDLSWIPFVP